MEVTIFRTLHTQYSEAIAAALDRILVAGIQWAVSSGPLRIGPLLGAFILIFGVMLMSDKFSKGDLYQRFGIALVICTVLGSSGFYDQYIRQFFMVVLPNSFSTAMNGGNITSIAGQFDNMLGALINMGTDIVDAAGYRLIAIAVRINVGALQFVGSIFLLVIFGVYEVSVMFMAIVVCLGPFLLVLALFKTTRHVVAKWFGVLVGLTVFQLSAAITITMFEAGALRFMQQAATAGGGWEVQMQTFGQIVYFFFFGALTMVLVPSLTAIGTGVAFHGHAGTLAGALIIGPARWVGGLGRAPRPARAQRKGP